MPVHSLITVLIHNSGHFGPPLPFCAPGPPALPGLPVASYATDSNSHTVFSRSLVQAPMIGHCPGTAFVETTAGMVNVQNPAIHGTTTPTAVIHAR